MLFLCLALSLSLLHSVPVCRTHWLQQVFAGVVVALPLSLFHSVPFVEPTGCSRCSRGWLSLSFSAPFSRLSFPWVKAGRGGTQATREHSSRERLRRRVREIRCRVKQRETGRTERVKTENTGGVRRRMREKQSKIHSETERNTGRTERMKRETTRREKTRKEGRERKGERDTSRTRDNRKGERTDTELRASGAKEA